MAAAGGGVYVARPFTVIQPQPGPNGQLKPQPSSRDRQAFARINPEDATDDVADLKRVLLQVQENSITATEPYRTNPLLHGELHRQVTFTSGKLTVIKHSLGEPFGGWWSVRARPGSGTFAAVEATNNAVGGVHMDPKMYLVLSSSCTGTYDIVITPG